MSLKRKLISIILTAMLIAIASGAVYAFGILNQITDGSFDISLLSINEKLDKDVINIAVFGIDGRDDEGVDGDRSDTIMIASLDHKNSAIKITSVMRDTLLRIPESPTTRTYFDKINSAYQFGGPQLAVQALNENLDLNIKDYIVVNFNCMVDTVDAIGGIDVNIADDFVLEWTNKFVDNINYHVNKNDPHIEGIGQQHLTGVQALAYSRQRGSDDDYKRTERQREVVLQILNKGKKLDMLSAVNLVGKVYPYIKTSLSMQEITDMAKSFMALSDLKIETFRIPVNNLIADVTVNGGSTLAPNSLIGNLKVLHQFIYGNDYYTPSETVVSINARIAAIAGLSEEGSTPTPSGAGNTEPNTSPPADSPSSTPSYTPPREEEPGAAEATPGNPGRPPIEEDVPFTPPETPAIPESP